MREFEVGHKARARAGLSACIVYELMIMWICFEKFKLLRPYTLYGRGEPVIPLRAKRTTAVEFLVLFLK